MTPNSVVDVLVKARALIEKPKNWCRGKYRFGNKYCAVGALEKVAPKFVDTANAYHCLCALIPNGKLTVFNDTHSHAEVLSLFDRAIASARATEERP